MKAYLAAPLFCLGEKEFNLRVDTVVRSVHLPRPTRHPLSCVGAAGRTAAVGTRSGRRRSMSPVVSHRRLRSRQRHLTRAHCLV